VTNPANLKLIEQLMDTLSEAMEFATAGRDSPHRTEIVMGVGSVSQPPARTPSMPPRLAI
jgi:hypothetical protein